MSYCSVYICSIAIFCTALRIDCLRQRRIYEVQYNGVLTGIRNSLGAGNIACYISQPDLAGLRPYIYFWTSHHQSTQVINLALVMALSWLA